MGRILQMTDFWSGAIMMAFLVAALFFLRFWRRSHDPIFLMFSLAFLIMGLNRLSLVAWHGGEQDTGVYAVRLLAYLLLLAALALKNRAPRRARAGVKPPLLGGDGPPHG